MKKYIIKAFAAVAFSTAMVGCSDFGDVNSDPEHPNGGNINQALVFSAAQHQALGSDWDVARGALAYTMQFVQQLSCLTNYTGNAFYVWNDGYAASYWDAVSGGRRGAAYFITDVMRKWEGDPAYKMDYNMARVIRVYIYQRLSDLYGDVQYTQGGQPDLYGYPVYDKQEDVYTDFLKELDEAQQAFAEGGTAQVGKQDLYYQGNIEKWRKFTNSLMLRVAMRLSKIKPDVAKEYAAKAVANGVILDNADNAMLQHTDGDPNNDSAEPYGKVLTMSDGAGIYFLSKTFVDLLKDTNDPRLALISTVCKDGPNFTYTNTDYNTGNSDPAIQQGLPSGYQMTDGEWYIGKDYPKTENGKDYWGLTVKVGTSETEIPKYKTEYSTVNRQTYSDPKAPTMIITAAEDYLLMAEAAYREWISGDAKVYYEKGVRAAMTQFSAYPNAKSLIETYLKEDAITKYLQDNPYDAGKALEQINTQYYIATFCDAYETYANWRRSGYPELTAVKGAATYPNSVTKTYIPRRFTYPVSESTINKANYEEALTRLGGKDDFTTRVWWDKE